MSTQIGEKTVFSLEEVARSIQKTISDRYGSAYWIQAEINKLNYYPHSGHCFPELVEKRDGKVVAEMRSVLWNFDYQRINTHFQNLVKEPLKDGIAVLLQASIQFDPVYGLSLKIHDIDPAFSLGQLELEKQASIQKLKEEGVFFLNKKLPFPLLPKRLAIISVETSKGYSDFMKIIQHNLWGYRFEHELFPAVLQGEKAVSSIKSQLQVISKRQVDFDVVLIVRGGGGDVGLSCYNHYELAASIARFPLPVMTGIGHSTNETVSEMVAYESAITPSELADFLIQRFHQFAEPVRQAQEMLAQKVPELLDALRLHLVKMCESIRFEVFQVLAQQKNQILHYQWSMKAGVHSRLQLQQHLLGTARHNISSGIERAMTVQKEKIHHLAQKVDLLDPIHVIKRGYSITTTEEGKLVMDANTVKPGTKLRTLVAHGSVESEVTGIRIEDK